ncbi:hypothetical protein VNO78_06481 [Psophocarpus tetragonolobus]|uniref:LYR motif containing domain-containing protein n=1 Tax=Psophocarpus tetragonolobus TaxID=3891 RepID=A0AAN9XR66_PSOTE
MGEFRFHGSGYYRGNTSAIFYFGDVDAEAKKLVSQQRLKLACFKSGGVDFVYEGSVWDSYDYISISIQAYSLSLEFSLAELVPMQVNCGVSSMLLERSLLLQELGINLLIFVTLTGNISLTQPSFICSSFSCVDEKGEGENDERHKRAQCESGMGRIWATVEDLGHNRAHVLSLYRQILRSLNSPELQLSLGARLAKKAEVRAMFWVGSDERSLHNIADLIDAAQYSLSFLRKGKLPPRHIT